MREPNAPSRLRGLDWVMAALAAAVGPHVPHLPAWVTLLLLAVCAWRWTADLRGWRLAPLPLRVVVVLVSTVAIFGTYRTLNGIEAGTAFLVLMAAAKLLETRTSRDLTVIVFIGWFLLYAALLREQSLSQLPWLLGSAFLTAVALMRVHAPSAQAPARHIVRRTPAAVAAGRAARAAAVPALSTAARAVLGHRCAQRGQDGSRRRDDAGRRLRPQCVRRSRLPRPVLRRHAAARATLLARPGAARIRRPQLAAAKRAGVSAAAGHVPRTRHPLPDHAAAARPTLGAGARPAVDVAGTRDHAVVRPDAAVGAPDQQRGRL